MQAIFLEPGKAGVPAESMDTEATSGFFWLDIERSESDWYQDAAQWLDTHLRDRHLVDSLNGEQLPLYDGTDDYDLLVLRTLDPASPIAAPTTRPVALFLTSRAVISVRPQGDKIFERTKERLLAGQRKAPATPVSLLALLTNQVVDQLLSRRETVSSLITEWQDRLFDREGSFDDWQPLATLRSHLRRLEDISEDQLDALSAWREQTNLTLDNTEQHRFEQLHSDLQRIFDHAAVMQADIDALVQIHYAAVGQRTNGTLRFLTVVSTVFLPLNLIAGIFGMNFSQLPFLQSVTAPWVIVGLMGVLAAGLMFISRKRQWF